MEPIKRIGPPTPQGMRGGEYALSMPLNAMPSAQWRRAFHAPERWEEPYHPSRVTVKGRELLFASEESRVRQWIQLIDGWIAAANDACAQQPTSSVNLDDERAEEERQRQHEMRAATERYKDL